MVSKHFLKTVILFMVMIAIGLIGVFLVSHYDIANKEGNLAQEPCPVAKPPTDC